MNEVNALLADNPKFKFVTVVFAPYTGSRTYTYKTLLDIKPEDFVVVDTPKNGLSMVQVREVLDPFDVDYNVSYDYKWVVQKIDLAAYEETMRMEKELCQKVNRVVRQRKVEEMKSNLLSEMAEEDRASVAKLVRL